jgi:DNA-binding NtrC family response regulator
MAAQAKQPERAGASEDRAAILVVEDDVPMREMIAEVLSVAEADVVLAKDSRHALNLLASRDFAVVVTDLRMPHADGMTVLATAKQHQPLSQVVVITGHATVDTAISAMKGGAFNYLCKPFEPTDLRREVEAALEFFRLNRANDVARSGVSEESDYHLVGKCAAMESVRKLIDVASNYDCCVLITGESGTGKEIVANRIHANGTRCNLPFVAVNCAAIPETLIESELFGYQKGAFTGAGTAKIGLFEAADGGTLFLDEINNATAALQAKLLRVLQDGIFYRMGDTMPRKVDVRVLAATNKPLHGLVASGDFRMDLYYRLKIIEVTIPPLRERLEDLPLLVNHFIRKHAARLKKNIDGISTKALNMLYRHNWPGNGRELENAVQRMIVFCKSTTIGESDIPADIAHASSTPAAGTERWMPQSLQELEMNFIEKTLREYSGNRAATAEILGIDKTTLWRKIKQYNIAVD